MASQPANKLRLQLPGREPSRHLEEPLAEAIAPKRGGRSRLLFAVLVALAALPFAGWLFPLTWLLITIGLIVGEQQWLSPPAQRARGAERDSGIFSWLLSAGYAIAALYFVFFHSGAAQTFGVTLYGVIMFQILVRDYANPKRLFFNLIPPALSLAIIQVAAVAWRIGEGQPLQIITVLASPVVVVWVFKSVQSDLTENRRLLGEAAARAEASARQIQEAHRIGLLATELTGIGHWRMDVSSQITTWSESVYKILGLPPSDDVPSLQVMLAMYDPDDRRQVEHNFSRLLRDGTPFAYEARITAADGQTRHIAYNGAAERAASGEVTTVFGTTLDVTQARFREQALAESEARYRMISDHSRDLIVWMGPEGNIFYVSPSVMLYGYSPDEVIGLRNIDFVHPDDRELAITLTRGLFTGLPVDTSVRREYRFRTANGRYAWLEGSPTIIPDKEGRPASIITSFRDISARRALEDELIEAKGRAEAASEAKAAFLSNMSHEIRTPLTGILGFSGLLRDINDLPPTASKYANRIATAGESLLSLVNDILDFSKIDAGRLDLDPHPFEIRWLVEETVELASSLAAQKGLGLTCEIDQDVPAGLFADSSRVRQVLLNLLTNAIKFTDQGGVTVRASYSEADGGQLRVSVIDTGCGIPADKVERLFERFSQADSSISRTHGGTGLGLAICRSLAEMMGGETGIESREGAGSTFWFTIAAPSAELSAQAVHIDADHGEPRPAHILVVDDVAANRELVTVMLTAIGHHISEASNGKDAVEAAMREPFDLILMDLQMPGMDGLAATRAIRALDSLNKETPILALSANAMNVHIAECAAAGMDDHISKPINPSILLTKVSQWAGIRGGKQQDREVEVA